MHKQACSERPPLWVLSQENSLVETVKMIDIVVQVKFFGKGVLSPFWFPASTICNQSKPAGPPVRFF